MANCVLAFVVGIALLVGPAESVVTVETIGEEVIVSLNGIELLKQSPTAPLFSLAIGTFDAIYNLGNYDITDNITETFPLEKSSIVYSGTSIFLHLTTDMNPSLGMLLEIQEVGANEMRIVPDYDYYPNENINRYMMNVVTTNDEQLWGGGEQYTYLNLRGRDYPIWVREQGFGRNKSSLLTQVVDLVSGAGGDYHTTYWPQPTFLSSRKYYFELEIPTYSELRLAPKNQSEVGHTIYWHRTHVPGTKCTRCNLRFITDESLMKIVQTINPGQPELPEWVYNGAILGVQGGTDKMLGYLQQADNASAYISALWIQDWSGKIVTNLGTRVFWNWRWNETWYPNLDTVIQDLLARDVRITAYINGHLNIEGDVYESLKDEPMWLSTKDGERLVQDFGQFFVATVDLMKEDPACNCINLGQQLYKDMLKRNLLDLGFSGWMADFGEYTPMEARTMYTERWWGEIDQEEILHQTHSEQFARLNRELLEENGKLDDTLVWMRSGGTRSKYYQTMSWAGDQAVDWTQSDGLKSSIVAALSLACNGMGLSHSDIGGYTGFKELNEKRSKELLLRWAEYAAFTPVMRTHEGNHPEENHQVYTDEDTFKQFARLTWIYRDLSEYTKEAVANNTLHKTPVMRPLFLLFENDEGSYFQDYEYMLGDDLLVAPVTEKGRDQWEVYLPGGETWVWLWDDLELPIVGPTKFTVNAVLGEPPVFYRFSSIWRDLFRRINDAYSISSQ